MDEGVWQAPGVVDGQRPALAVRGVAPRVGHDWAPELELGIGFVCAFPGLLSQGP